MEDELRINDHNSECEHFAIGSIEYESMVEKRVSKVTLKGVN
jgi:hypothetical protein